jgi:enoyl-CoA hydratase/carnithine racemase
MQGAAGLDLTFHDATVEVVIDRGDENLFTVEMCEALTAVLREPPEGAHLLHLRADGPAFCLGRERTAVGADGLRAETEALIALNRAITASPLVTVAEVQGDAAGYGVGVAALCDLSIAAPSAHFWFPEVRIDLAPTIVLTWLGPLVGRKQAFLLTATGEPIDGRRAAQIGLVTEVACEDSGVRDTVATRLQSLQRYSPQVHADIKRFLSLTSEWSVDDAYELAAVKLSYAGLARQLAKPISADD